MTLKWAQVAEKPEYAGLNEQDKALAKVQYFNEVARPQVAPEDLPEARSQFFSYANGLDPAATKGKKSSGATRGFTPDEPSALDMVAEGTAHGLLGVGKSLGTGLRWAGSRTGTDSLKLAGQKMEIYYGEPAKEFEAPKELQGSIIEKPALLKSPAWWAYNVAEMVPSFAASIIPGVGAAKYLNIAGTAMKLTPSLVAKLSAIGGAVAGGVAGGALEGTGTYSEIISKGGTESDAAKAAELMTLASAGLNAISVGKALTPGSLGKIKHILTSAGVESITEYLEEPAEAAIKYGMGYATPEEVKKQLIEGVNVIPITALMGGAGGAAGRAIVQPQPPVDEGLVPPAAPAPETAAEPSIVAPGFQPEVPPARPETPPATASGLPSWVPQPKGPVMTPGGPVDIASPVIETAETPPPVNIERKPIEAESTYREIRENEGPEAETLARGLNQQGIITIDTHVRDNNIVMQIHGDEETLGRIADTGVAVERVPSKPGIDESYKIRVPKNRVEKIINEISAQPEKAPQPVKKPKARKPSSGAQALMAATVAELKKAGGLKLGAVELTGTEKKKTGAYGITDSTTIRSLIKQYPGLLRRNGGEWDEAAEQWGFTSGADLLEALKDPTRGPSMRNNMAEMPEAEEAKIDKQLEREIWENAERELAAFAESEGIDAGAIQQGQGDSKESILDEIRAEGIIDPAREAEVLKELEDFFAGMDEEGPPLFDPEQPAAAAPIPEETPPRKVTGQGDLTGMSYAETFGLAQPKGKFRPFVEKPLEPPSGALFEEEAAVYESALDKNGGYDIVQAKAKGLVSDELQQDVASLGSSFTSQRLQISSAGRGTVVKPGGVKTIASAIPKDLLKKGYANLRGAEVKSPRDLAAVAQIFRDPRVETLRIFYVKDGKIVAHEGLSNRMPGFVSFYSTEQAPKEVVKIHSRIKRTGADQIYLLHNHPGGRPVPSGNDIYFTKLLSEGQVKGVKDETEPLPLISHVIIDDKQYAEIFRILEGPGVSWDYKIHDLPAGKEYGAPEVPHDFLAKEVNGQQDIADIAQSLKRQDGYATLLYRSSTGKLVGIQDVPIGILKGPEAMGFLKNRAREFGARETMVYVDDINSIGAPKAKHLIEYGGVRDVLSKGEGFARQYQGRPGILFGEPWTKYQPMRVMEENAGYKPTPEERKVYAENPKLAIELPEIVEFAHRALEGRFPSTRRFLGKAIGRFYPGSGKIHIINNLDMDTLAKVLAHEVGHAADWLPDKDMRKGNILGRIASVPHYLKTLLEEYPGAPGKVLTDADRARFRKEAAQQVKKESLSDSQIVEEITRVVPRYEQVLITPEMILDILRGRTNEPDILLRFLQEVDGAAKKEIAKKALQNLVDESLAGLKGRKITGYDTVTEKVVKETRTKTEEAAQVAKRYRELLKEEILKRRLYEKEVIIQELRNLTQAWKPFTPVEGDSYTKYRFSSKELYADAVSVLFNDPAMLLEKSPVFHKAFFNYFERKPELKAIYDEMQTRAADPEAVLEQRRQFERGMADEGARIRIRQEELQKKRESLTPSVLWGAVRRAFGEKNVRALEITEKALAAGAKIPDHQRLDYWVEELPYINSEVFAWQRGIELHVIGKATEQGIDLVDLHEYMILKRAATERKGIYSPGGIGDVFADRQLDYMRKQVGDVKFRQIEALVKDFRDQYERKVLKAVQDAGFLPDDLMKKMMENPNYATFANLDYLINERAGKGTGAKIYKQYGMLGKVDNVFVQTVLKGSALIRAARHHQTKMAMLNSPEVQTAHAKRGPKGVGWAEPKDQTMGLIVVTPEGKAAGYYIDKEIADIWNNEPDKAEVVTRVGLAGLGLIKGFLANVFIKWNIPWIVKNPIRDTMATWKKVPETSGYLAGAMKDTLHDAFQAGRGLLPEREQRLLEEHVLVRDRFFSDPGSMFEVEREFLKGIDDPSVYTNKVTAPFLRAAHWLNVHKNYFIIPRISRGLEVLGKTGERWSKFAAEEAMTRKSKATGIPVETMRRRHLVRTRAGTPNSYAQGVLHTITEAIFPFSNIGLQDMRSSIEAFKEDKKGYGIKTFAANILPKILFWGMVAGYFGDDIKKAAGKVGRYYRRMYGTIPIMVTGDQETLAITIPQDYQGQIIGALVDAALEGSVVGPMGSLGIVSEGQPYNMNPIITTSLDWLNYYSNKVAPVNQFYGSKIMTENEAKAGGKYAAGKMARYTWNQFFGNMLYKMPMGSVEPVKSKLAEVLGWPVVNGLGSLVRVTRQGEMESFNEISEKVGQQRAVESIEIERAIGENLMSKTPKKPEQLFADLVNKGVLQHKLYGDVNQALKSFMDKYQSMIIMRSNVPFLKAWKRAGSKEAKDALIGEMMKKQAQGK